MTEMTPLETCLAIYAVLVTIAAIFGWTGMLTARLKLESFENELRDEMPHPKPPDYEPPRRGSEWDIL